MAEVSNELIYEVVKAVQARLEQVDGKVDELKQAMRMSQNSLRHELASIHNEIASVHATLVRHEHRLDRIERCIELNQVRA